MSQTITLSGVKTKVKRHLSIIGKRMYDKEGKNLFSNITTSSAEDPIFDHYTAAAAHNLAAALAQFVTAYSDTSITVDDSRWDANVSTALKNAAESYAMLFTVGEYLAMTHADLAEKYYRDAQTMMNTIIMTAFYKKSPTQPSYSYADVTGTINS